MTYPNEPAFSSRAASYPPDGGYIPAQEGLSKREYFAAMAMQGLLAALNIYETGVDHDVNSMHSVLAADALIKALNEIKPTEK